MATPGCGPAAAPRERCPAQHAVCGADTPAGPAPARPACRRVRWWRPAATATRPVPRPAAAAATVSAAGPPRGRAVRVWPRCSSAAIPAAAGPRPASRLRPRSAGTAPLGRWSDAHGATTAAARRWRQARASVPATAASTGPVMLANKITTPNSRRAGIESSRAPSSQTRLHYTAAERI